MRVITADDNRVMAMVLKQIFGGLGHEVVDHVRNGRDAVEACRKHRPDLVVLDVVMPPMNGDEAAQVIADEHLATSIIFATSNTQDPIKHLATRLGARVVFKPYREDSMRKAIEEIAREQSERRSHDDRFADCHGD